VTLPKVLLQLRQGISFFKAQEGVWLGTRSKTLTACTPLLGAKTSGSSGDND